MKKLASILSGIAVALPSLLWADSDPVTYVTTPEVPAICSSEPSLPGYVRCDMTGNSNCENRERSGRFTTDRPGMTDCNLTFIHPDPTQVGTWIDLPLKRWEPDTGIHSNCLPNLPTLAQNPILIRRLKCQTGSPPTRIVAKYLNNPGDCK